MNFFQKNKMILMIALALGLFLAFAWKTDFSFLKYFQTYNPSQQNPPTMPQPQVQPQGSQSEAAWRRLFEQERAR